MPAAGRAGAGGTAKEGIPGTMWTGTGHTIELRPIRGWKIPTEYLGIACHDVCDQLSNGSGKWKFTFFKMKPEDGSATAKLTAFQRQNVLWCSRPTSPPFYSALFVMSWSRLVQSRGPVCPSSRISPYPRQPLWPSTLAQGLYLATPCTGPLCPQIATPLTPFPRPAFDRHVTSICP